MTPEMKRQVFQAVGQFVVVVVTGLLAYKDYATFMQTGIANALWQPTLQGIMAVAAIWGISKIPVGTPK